MKRFLLLVVLIPHIILAEDIYFKVIETTPAWEDINFPKPSNISDEIPQESIVLGFRGIQFSSLKGVFEDVAFQIIFYNDEEMLIYADSVIPLETQDLFGKELIYNPEKILISSVFLNAFQPDKRDIIYLHNKKAWDEYITWIDNDYGGGVYYSQGDGWWSYFGSADELIITQTALSFRSNVKNDSDLLIKNIKRTKEGYILTIKESVVYQKVDKWWNWPEPQKQEFFTVILVSDGDYIDLYLENKNNLIDTFVFVNKEFIIQLNNHLKFGKSVDLTNVSLPKRADGSMDYQLSELSPITTTEDKNPQSDIDTEKSSMPLWALIAIIGVFVAVSACTALFVVKRRK